MPNDSPTTMEDLLELWAQRDRDASRETPDEAVPDEPVVPETPREEESDPPEEIPTSAGVTFQDEGVPLIHFQDESFTPTHIAEKKIEMVPVYSTKQTAPVRSAPAASDGPRVFQSYNIGLPTISLSEHK